MSDPLVTVVLLGIPVGLHRRAAEHQQTLRRELALVAAGPEAEAGARLEAVSGAVRDRFASFTAAQAAALEDAPDGAVIDLAYEVPPDAADAAERLGALLDEVDVLCRRGELVSLSTPPDLVAYRRWFLGAFVDQIREDREPVPWCSAELLDTVAAPASSAAGPCPPEADGPPVIVDGDLDLFGAASLRSTIAERLAGGQRRLHLDISRCGFIDSVGLSLLLTTRERCCAAGGGLVVSGADESALRLFDTVGVRSLLIP